ncbi:MAG: hypothetical protein A2W93_10895 [Bacteroidetes bacterium GWF2_43_63]|nr:MAG: hypothetical protein A2W93_10895 [Bacteroidetes bacterium GWF2_43_63]HBG72015.1 hypothetical protein [Bacteroidales bacterium]
MGDLFCVNVIEVIVLLSPAAVMLSPAVILRHPAKRVLQPEIKNDNGANIIFHRPMATKEAEDMESLCLRQNRRFHILRFSPNDGISVLLICLTFSGIR